MAQPGSAPALGAGGRRFKSARPDLIFLGIFRDLAGIFLIAIISYWVKSWKDCLIPTLRFISRQREWQDVFRLAGAGDEEVMDCKGARRLIPPGDALANLKGEWEKDPCTVF